MSHTLQEIYLPFRSGYYKFSFTLKLKSRVQHETKKCLASNQSKINRSQETKPTYSSHTHYPCVLVCVRTLLACVAYQISIRRILYSTSIRNYLHVRSLEYLIMILSISLVLLASRCIYISSCIKWCKITSLNGL